MTIRPVSIHQLRHQFRLHFLQLALAGALAALPSMTFAQGCVDLNACPTAQHLNFRDLDKDRSGSIEDDELLQLSPDLVKKMDFNGDGVISEAEFDMYLALTTGGLIFGRY
jgi:hypothetical protein